MARNTRLAGHELRAEGAAFKETEGNRRGLTRVHPWGVGGIGFAVCSCGKRSPEYYTGADRKKWHRRHKDEVRAQ